MSWSLRHGPHIICAILYGPYYMAFGFDPSSTSARADQWWSELIKRSLSYFSDFNLPWVNNEFIMNLIFGWSSLYGKIGTGQIKFLSFSIERYRKWFLRVYNWFGPFWCIWIQKRNGLFSTLWSKKSQINAPLTMSWARNLANTVKTPINPPQAEGLPFLLPCRDTHSEGLNVLKAGVLNHANIFRQNLDSPTLTFLEPFQLIL